MSYNSVICVDHQQCFAEKNILRLLKDVDSLYTIPKLSVIRIKQAAKKLRMCILMVF